ncbi:MAG: DEAD/DEAH box helicase [Planctomycetota bacterium]|nr:DEAD/DEAH box helicase [Planctomycetota bacterium]
MMVLHAVWSDGALALWGEVRARVGVGDGASREPGPAGVHPWQATAEELATALGDLGVRGEPGMVRLRLPTRGGAPMASPALAHAFGQDAHDEEREGGAVTLGEWSAACVRIGAGEAAGALERLDGGAGDEDEGSRERVRAHPSASVRFYAAAARLARSLVAQQRVVPALVGNGSGLQGRWQPWTRDEATQRNVDGLVRAMPPAARAAVDALEHHGGAIVEDFLGQVVDVLARASLERERMAEAIEDRDPLSDAQVAWLSGLLGAGAAVNADEPRRTAMLKTVRRWIAGLDDRGAGGSWRLCLTLSEPIFVKDLPDLQAPGSDIVWTLSFHLQSVENEDVIVDAEDVWALRAESATVKGRRVERPQDLLLKELARASRLYRGLEPALSESQPLSVELNTNQAYEFLREWRPVLVEQGFGVIVPEWWDSPAARIGARLQLNSQEADPLSGSVGSPGSVGRAQLGLNALVGYQWQIAVGETPLTLADFEKLAASRAPLVRIDGRWVEVRPEDVRSAVEFIRENPGGEMPLADALRLAYRSDVNKTGVPILGLDATGWVATMLGATGGEGASMPVLVTPEEFKGELRPYQARGLSWLSFLDSMGMGPCLADDMGLGKTIQLLAMLLHERKQAEEARAAGSTDAEVTEVHPTLLVVPMSIVSNWKREAQRFAPTLRVLIHHGVERASGDAFFHAALKSDLVITTYALAHRDRELIELIPWRRVVLDEAQNIKNPSAKQSQAVRNLPVTRRIALTGTPLENRLSELWSIMDFCNPGFLGTLADFRRYFAVPIERYHDKERSRKLRSLVRPFILRRLKTDPAVISDLPAKLETKEFCKLTSEQASLYETCVKEMLSQVDKAEGIRRRGLVLTALIRLKQICNHPLQLPQDEDAASAGPAGDVPPARSGKCIRLIELLEEVLASGEQALVFTQFRQMATLLGSMLRSTLDREVLVLHGGTSQGQRQQMIDRFQKGDGSAPVLVLSLKAGGVGLNLTAASHVFHFDRWWNPAVENQATDRAFRIGQTRTVSVHKFVVSGTLEERIDQMIESKIALAEDVIGSGEDWLTELSTAQLRDILTLRPEALVDE